MTHPNGDPPRNPPFNGVSLFPAVRGRLLLQPWTRHDCQEGACPHELKKKVGTWNGKISEWVREWFFVGLLVSFALRVG